MTDDIRVTVPSGEVLVRRDGDVLKVGRQVGDDVTWTDEVAVSLLPENARTALDEGNGEDPALQLALQSIAEAEGERGG